MKHFLSFLILTIFMYSQSFKFAALSDGRGSDNDVNSMILTKLVIHLVINHSEMKSLLFPGDLVEGCKTDPQNFTAAATLEENNSNCL